MTMEVRREKILMADLRFKGGSLSLSEFFFF